MRDIHFSLSPPRLAFLAWGDFHARSRFSRSTVPEEKWGLLVVYLEEAVQSAIGFGKYENLNMSFFACGTLNLN